VYSKIAGGQQLDTQQIWHTKLVTLWSSFVIDDSCCVFDSTFQASCNKCDQEYKRKSSMEAELKCLRAVGSMDERLRNACNTPNATFDSVVKVGNSLLFPLLSLFVANCQAPC
jgi:hypothetical protein